jgi:hypothetical protein
MWALAAVRYRNSRRAFRSGATNRESVILEMGETSGTEMRKADFWFVGCAPRSLVVVGGLGYHTGGCEPQTGEVSDLRLSEREVKRGG